MDLKNWWGYGTKKDGEKWTAQICENCVDTKLSFINFKKDDQEMVTRISTIADEEDYLDELLIKQSSENTKTN